jgi:transposase
MADIAEADQLRLREALRGVQAADQELRDAVVSATQHGGSVRKVAALTGLSTNTVFRWKRDAEQL